jgi:hypothetical protein
MYEFYRTFDQMIISTARPRAHDPTRHGIDINISNQTSLNESLHGARPRVYRTNLVSYGRNLSYECPPAP